MRYLGEIHLVEMLNRQLEKQLWGSRERPRDIALGISIYWEVIIEYYELHIY